MLQILAMELLAEVDQLFKINPRPATRKAVAMGNVPAYIIYTDKTLKEIALAKARQFGVETLAIVL